MAYLQLWCWLQSHQVLLDECWLDCWQWNWTRATRGFSLFSTVTTMDFEILQHFEHKKNRQNVLGDHSQKNDFSVKQGLEYFTVVKDPPKCKHLLSELAKYLPHPFVKISGWNFTSFSAAALKIKCFLPLLTGSWWGFPSPVKEAESRDLHTQFQ